MRQLVVAKWLMTNDPPVGTDPSLVARGLNHLQLAQKLDQYDKDAGEFGIKLKAEIVGLSDSVQLWKLINNLMLVVASILVIVGTILNLKKKSVE